MCGFAGFVDFKGRSGMDVLMNMANAVSHRGPDDSGYELLSPRGVSIGLGFRRLAILDLSIAGHQPMKNPDTGDFIIFNGEIYNFREVRKELEGSGFTFHSTGDTEVILRAYQHWGKSCVDKFIGMFSIVLYDERKQKIVCIRDRAGVKPLFYYWKNDVFLFGSELKSFHHHPSFEKEIDNNALAYYFQHGYISSPHSIFNDTYQLKPGSWLELDLNSKKISTETYWNVNTFYNKPQSRMSYEEVLDKTEELLISAFNYRMISDVPVGVFLSGGYDSSCVAAILQKTYPGQIRTYTIGFDEPGFNEAPYAKEVAANIGSDHHEYYCSFKDAMHLVPKLPEIYDQPFGDPSAVPTTLISRIAREHVTVALSADGGDELFAGYPRHLKSLNYIKKFKGIPFFARSISSNLVPGNNKSLLTADRNDKLRRVLNTRYESEMFDVINQTFSAGELQRLLKFPAMESENPFQIGKELSSEVETLNKILAVDYSTYLVDDILQKVDRASMSVSLEAREPFLDHRLVEFLATVPSNYKMEGNFQKKILKDIVHKYIPKKIMDRPKMGFGIPLDKWCRSEMKELFMDFMSDAALSQNEYINAAEVAKIRDGYMKGQLQNFERIWFVFVFQMWYKHWMK